MRAPAFWWSATPGLFGRTMTTILTPLAALYGRAAARRMGRAGSRISAPVICIGNFVVGGAGKTPTALAVAKWLKRAGETPYFLSRGYGGALSADGGAHLVDQRRHCAAEAGDEPLLLARVAQTVVARDRPTGAMLALAGGASLIVMDDGLQNPSLRRDFALAVIDGAVGFGNGRLLPAGPLRAPIDLQLKHSSAALVIGEGDAGRRRRPCSRQSASRCSTAASPLTRTPPCACWARRSWPSPASDGRRNSSIPFRPAVRGWSPATASPIITPIARPTSPPCNARPRRSTRFW